MTLTDGGLWQVDITELPEVRPAPLRSLSRMEARARTAIAQGEGVDPDALALEVTTSTGDPQVDADVEHVRALRDKADDLARQAEEARAAARQAAEPIARHLVHQRGVSVRDAGAVLGGYSGAVISRMTQYA
ncbi:hypothetical protein [Streptomyces sp. 891-h]|uniref:hypothetical protein n=1 Tax=Streptomyces sp. 891-h TaxID=2720714 RepID=UPI001FA9E436|nr:hypothetical protein [Streptomyces sp. 891-h]UNZ22305.1 hypothetical protein HC362_34625 [Streptomyces sp. 891-h]